MKRTFLILFALLFLFTSRAALALLMPWNEGKWPATWPKELDSFRKDAQTLDVATGKQEHIHTIPFKDRETFEKLWPILLGLRTPGSPITLSKIGQSHPGWGKYLSNKLPCIRIKGPSSGYTGGTSKNGQLDLKELEAGTMLFAGGPWPKELMGANGELPEYVSAGKTNDGKLTWVLPETVPERQRGFLHRARMEIEIVIDGEIIDLNRIRLPQDALIVDTRFPEAAAPPSLPK